LHGQMTAPSAAESRVKLIRNLASRKAALKGVHSSMRPSQTCVGFQAGDEQVISKRPFFSQFIPTCLRRAELLPPARKPVIDGIGQANRDD
jgi:hypothetical protein